ncbi:sel1 repeat family protein [Akkermansiaceae bacterium]|nr:sel1 repeat family protein [Akkermansiaceae bacterium]
MKREQARVIADSYSEQCEAGVRHWGVIDQADQECREFLFFNTDYCDDDLPPEEDGISCFGYIDFIKEGEPLEKYMDFVMCAIERPSEAKYEINSLIEANFVRWFFGGGQETADGQCDLGDIYRIGTDAMRGKVANVNGSEYRYGYAPIEKDAEEAVKWYRRAADQGNATAQYSLGRSYDYGEGVEKDAEEAVKWYRKAAEQGNATAQSSLGWNYDNGEGVEKDAEEAVKWYRKAADQGDAPAQYNLGWSYDNGEGVEKDAEEAVKWYRKAADQGDAPAQYNLGLNYDNGEGVEKDAEEAVKWYRKAADQGIASAQKNLGWVLFDRGDLEGAEKVIRKGLSELEELHGNGDHEDTLEFLNQLSVIKITRNKKAIDEIEKLSRRAIASSERLLGPGDDMTLGLSGNFIIFLKQINRHEEAAECGYQAYIDSKKVNGLDSPMTMQLLNVYAGALKSNGDLEGAISCLKESFAHSEKTRDALSYNLACYECLNENYEEAKTLIFEHIERCPEAKEIALSDSDLEGIRDSIRKI